MNLASKLIGLSLIATSSFVYAETFTPNGSIGLTQTFYGNSGSYKTATSHPSLSFNYNFSP